MLFADLFYMWTLWFEDRIRFFSIGSFHVDKVTNQVHVISILFNVKVSLCFYKAFFLTAYFTIKVTEACFDKYLRRPVEVFVYPS